MLDVTLTTSSVCIHIYIYTCILDICTYTYTHARTGSKLLRVLCARCDTYYE